MFQKEHFVAGPAPWPWNQPFPKLVHHTGPDTPEVPPFQLQIRPTAPSCPKSRSLYTYMTLPQGRGAPDLIGWFIREPPYKGFVPARAPLTLEGSGSGGH